jgi:hypothetical protein
LGRGQGLFLEIAERGGAEEVGRGIVVVDRVLDREIRMEEMG